jgi:hypothetical protein
VASSETTALGNSDAMSSTTDSGKKQIKNHTDTRCTKKWLFFCNFNQQMHTTVIRLTIIFLKTLNSYTFQTLPVPRQGVH